MTVCVSVKVSDSLVFAADRATTIFNGGGGIANVYNHANKVFALYKGLPIVAMTCGLGSLAGSSIAVVAKDFRGLLASDDGEWRIDPKNYSIQDVAEKAYKYFYENHYRDDPNKPKGPHTFELFIGGFPSGSRKSEVWKFTFQNGAATPANLIAPQDNIGVWWSGQPEAINRLLLGFGQNLRAGLQAGGIKEAELDAVVSSVQTATQSQLVAGPMPVQDAVDLARFLVDTTIGYTKFLPGANTVGGGVDIATVTRHEGFKWITRPHYYSPELNPLETDHVGNR